MQYKKVNNLSILTIINQKTSLLTRNPYDISTSIKYGIKKYTA